MSKSKVTSRNTNSNSNAKRSLKRANPMIPKAGVTRSGRRSFSNGGKIK